MLSSTLSLWLLTSISLATPTPPVAKPSKSPKPSKTKKTSTVRLGPMLFTVQGGKVKSIKQIDLKELYRAASKMYQQKKYPIAIHLYKRLLKYFPKSKHRYAALYNLALAYEDNRQFQLAIKTYQKVILENPQRKNLTLNAKFRTAACYNQLKQWKAAFATYDQILQETLTLSDRIDALAYAGRALFQLKHYAQAYPLFQLATKIYLSQKKPQINYSAAMAQYYQAYIHDLKFRKRKFHLPQSQLKKDLDYKSTHLLKAQKKYFQTIRFRHTDWALAALYRIGDMYETMYQDMMNAPIPKDLKKEEVTIYQELLRKKIKVLLTKALRAYRMNLKLSVIVGLKNHEWKQRSQKRLHALIKFYQKRFGEHPEHPRKTQTATSKPASQPTTQRGTP